MPLEIPRGKNEAESPMRQPSSVQRPRRISLDIGTLLLLSVLPLGVGLITALLLPQVQHHRAVEACRNAGGTYDDTGGRCLLPAPSPPELPGR